VNYTPTAWVDGDTGGTPLTAARLNNIEDGVVAANGTVPLRAYMSPMSKSLYPASDISSYTLTSTMPSFASMISVVPSATPVRARYGGVLNDSVVVNQFFNNINGAANGPVAGYTSYETEFYLSGTSLAIVTENLVNSDYQVFVDDQPLSQAWSTFGTATPTLFYIEVIFASSRVRRIRVIMGVNSLIGFYLPGSSAIWPAQPRKRVAVISDSYGTGPTSTSEGAILAGNLCGELAVRGGLEVWNLSQGSTGVVNNAGGTNGETVWGSTSRMAALGAIPRPDIILIFGGGDDSNFATYPEAATLAAHTALWNAINTAFPTIPLVVAGIESGSPSGFVTADMTQLNTDMKTLALANPAVTKFVDMRSVPWITGTGNLGSPVGDGNADLFMSSDAVHPSHAGYGYYADRLLYNMESVPVAA
jgi:lysophospholipase L1-like esterase